MAANKKRRRFPEEDLTAAVEETIRSPITRANLNFLNMGPDSKPMGAEPDPAGPAVPLGGFETPLPAAEIDVRTLWRAEQIGTLFDVSRVRRIQQAQDALSLAEEKVYNLLWGQKHLKKDEFRLVHFSLQRIAREARLNIKTVRELIPRLVAKGFIDVEAVADARRNLPTLYRVWSYGSVFARQRQQNRLYVLKTGKGVFYAHPVQASIEPEPPGV